MWGASRLGEWSPVGGIPIAMTYPSETDARAGVEDLCRVDLFGPPDGLSALRRKLAEQGSERLSEADVLTLLLYGRAGLRRDELGRVVEALLVRFGSTPRIFGATPEELAPVAGTAVAAELKLVHELNVRVLAFPIDKRCVLTSFSGVSAYLRAALGGASREQFRVLFLDKANQLIADEVMGIGTVDHASVYPREIMRRALELGASACCLAHNHPTGGANPSGADVEMTRRVVEAGKALGIVVHDHFLVAGDEVVSFKALGLM